VGDRLWTLAQSAEAGSDAQFQFVKVLAAVTTTPAHLDAVQALREGTTTLPGLEIDTDLSWELLIALVAGGRADASDIDAALAADNTATGAQSAANARAAIPTAEAKRAAWDSVTLDDSAPNTIVRATGLGFQHTSDPAVLEAMVPVYFDALRSLWDAKSYKIAEYLVVGFYPAATPTPAIVDATRAWLDANPDVPALRRLVIENLAGVERALRAQERDAAL
jgi:aminopeptidase N